MTTNPKKNLINLEIKMSNATPNSKELNAGCDQSTTNHKASGTGISNISQLPFFACFFALPLELRINVYEIIFCTNLSKTESTPVSTDPGSTCAQTLDVLPNLPCHLPCYQRLLDECLPLFFAKKTLSITMDRSSPHPVPNFLQNPNIAPHIKRLALPQPQVLNQRNNPQYTFPPAVSNLLTGLETISFSSRVAHRYNDPPYPETIVGNDEYISRLPLLFYSEILVKRPEVKVILIACYYRSNSSEPYKHRFAIGYRIVARGSTAILEKMKVAKEGDALWERGILRGLVERGAYRRG